MGVVFFPSLPFMGVMLFPSFVLGNASGEGGGFLAMLSLFFFLLLLSFFSLLPFFLPQLSYLLLFFFFLSLSSVSTLFFIFSFLPITLLFFFSPYHTPIFLFPLSCLLLILSFSFVPFFFEGIACTECFSRCNRGHH